MLKGIRGTNFKEWLKKTVIAFGVFSQDGAEG